MNDDDDDDDFLFSVFVFVFVFVSLARLARLLELWWHSYLNYSS